PEKSEGLSQKAASRLWELTQEALPGSDNQLQFVRAFAALASTSEQLDVVEKLFTGVEALPGTPLDSDLTWDFLTSLVAGGRRGNTDIAAQLEQDNTASGQ